VEKEWRKVDNKRRRVEEKTAQVALLARLSALMGGFQVAMFINQGLPSAGDTYPAPKVRHISVCPCPPLRVHFALRI
jgi:hypothetical protein